MHNYPYFPVRRISRGLYGSTSGHIAVYDSDPPRGDWEIHSTMAALCGKWDYVSAENLEEYMDKSGMVFL